MESIEKYLVITIQIEKPLFQNEHVSLLNHYHRSEDVCDIVSNIKDDINNIVIVYDSGNYIVLETNLRKEYSVSN
jgi:hypothetical protein